MPIAYRKTNLGIIGIAEEDGKITRLFFENQTVPTQLEHKETPLLKEAFSQLDEYLSGGRKAFDLPLMPHSGTAWQQKCWDALLAIPYGETVRYKDIAERVGNPRGFRAVGLSCNRNPIPIFIPCHRVVGSDGSLTGFGGGLSIKEKLLALEKENRS